MGIIASFDKHPVYIDNDGNPLASGKIHYYAIGTTTPKTVYSDYTLTTPAANPQICGADGRTPTQIFLGTGEYTCISRKFNGTDPNTAPDTDWDTVTSQWVEEGQPTPSVASLTDAVYVTTIANLRLIDANALSKTNFMVMGYWSEGDMFPRTYHWDALSLLPDNKGTVIKNPSISTGAFILDVGNTDVMDCRIFGIIHNRAASNNAAISAMVTEVQNNAKLPQTIYFPRGIYDVVPGIQYFDTPVKFDVGCQFKNTTVGAAFVLGIRSTFENLSVDTIKASASVDTVYFDFSNTDDLSEVDVRWYGCKCDDTTDDGPAFQTLISHVTKNYPLKISAGILRISSLSANLTIPNPIHFHKNGGLRLNQNTYNLIFTEGYLESKGSTSCIQDANLGNYRFTNHKPIPTSVMAGDLKNFFLNWGANLTNKQVVEIDCDGSFGSGLSLAQTANIVCRWKKGLLSCNTATPVFLTAMDAPPNAQIFSAAGLYCGGYTHADWFPNIRSALLSVHSAGGTLDLDGKTYDCSSTPINITESYNDTTIKNGNIQLAGGTYNWITIKDLATTITWDSVYVLTGASDINAITIDGVSVTKFYVKNCIFLSFGNGYFFQPINSGLVYWLDITASDIRWKYGVLVDSTNSCIDIHNNTNLQCINVMTAKSLRFVGNYVYGGTGYFTKTEATLPPVISNNNFYEHYIKAYTNASGIVAHNITGNTFHSTPNQVTGVVIVSDVANSRARGLIIQGNTFTADDATGAFIAIFPVLEGVGTWYIGSTASGHVMNISNNSGAIVTHYTNSIPDTWKIKVPMTKGNGIVAFPKSALSYTSVGDSNVLELAIPSDAFVLQGTKVRPSVTGNMYYDWNGVAVHYYMSEKLSFLGCRRAVAYDYLLANVRVDYSLSSINSDWEAGISINYDLYPEQD